MGDVQIIKFYTLNLFHLLCTVQIIHNLNGTRVCAKAKNTRGIKPLVYTHLHACKMNAPHTRTYPYEVSATKRSSLQPVVP